ncbi:MAG: cytochrome-c oxidase, cbb3-type subunit III [Pseudohongiella sp.]|uniref:cytochrome-c oxidase, cbb3-type subunit III n=1 Tax=Pseudohongiella sp. TaxID=1979412 RepID=UPI0034A0522F
MADLPSGFWAGWILVVTLVSLAAVAWLVWSIYFGRDQQEESEIEPVWDETLAEGHNPPPLWWFWLLFGGMVFSLIYLILFPGLGSNTGLLNWSQGKRVADSYDNFEASFADVRATVVDMDLLQIQGDLALMATAERIYQRECAVCHGPEARGQASLFPNLQDTEWQWGGSPEQIEQTLRGGRRANMIAWQSILDTEVIDNVAGYVMTMHEGGDETHPGKAMYEQNCAACHGVDGAGNEMLGASRLSDDVWLYGGDYDTIRETLLYGRTGQMPAFDERLDDFQIKLLVAWLAR